MKNLSNEAFHWVSIFILNAFWVRNALFCPFWVLSVVKITNKALRVNLLKNWELYRSLNTLKKAVNRLTREIQVISLLTKLMHKQKFAYIPVLVSTSPVKFLMFYTFFSHKTKIKTKFSLAWHTIWITIFDFW